MSFKTFDVPTMVAVSGPWVDPKQDRPVLAYLPLVAPLLPKLDGAHSELVRIGARNSQRSEQLRVLSNKAQELDRRHDLKLRGVFNVLTSWAELEDDEAQAQKLLAIRDRLFSEGLAGVRRTYLAEAGYVDMTAQNITDDIRSRLSTISCNGTTLADQVDAWIDAGRTLGHVERQRVQLASSRDEQGFSAAEVNKARARWSLVTEALLSLLELTPDLDEAVRVRIVEPLQNAEEKLLRRRRAGNIEPTRETPDSVTGPEPESETEATPIPTPSV